MFHFDPQGEALDARPSYMFKTGTLAGSAKVTFQIKRFTALAGPPSTYSPLPYQLFGAMFGIHEVEDSAKYSGYRPASSPLVTDDAIETLRANYSSFLSAVGAATVLGDVSGAATGAGVTATENHIFDRGNIVRWEPDGSLLIGNPNINVGAGYHDYLIISCKEIPYRLFLKSLEDAVIKIDRVRMTYKDQDTLSEIWNLAGRSMFGATDGNDLIPTDYFEPNQQQANVIDVTQPLIIDGETALNSIMPVGESLISYICSVTEVINNNLRSE